MKIRRTLTHILLGGALALGTTGCSKSMYHIGDDEVIFATYLGGINTLTVTKPDGRVIRYVDRLKNDLNLEAVEITVGGNTRRYTANNEVGRPVLEEAQRQFDAYLHQIKKARFQSIQDSIDQALENLK
ncbi:MAG: hypothetical protein AABW49_01030 [Nanoarchaeota archaeon]|mgnify:CR=1 FL=1